MGIKLDGSNFDTQDFQVLQAKAAENNVTMMAETEQQVIDKFEELNNITLNGKDGSYSYSYEQKERETENDYDNLWRPTQNTNTNLGFSNVQLTNNPQWQIFNIGNEIEDTSKETDDYKYFYRIVTYQYQINYKHFQESSTTISGNIWTNNARVIYHRKTCSYSYEEPIDDGYEGSDNISIILEQKVKWSWSEEKEEEIVVPATTFGAFPSGISADYCILVAKQDNNFVKQYENNTSKLDNLNDIINDYEEKTNPYYTEKSKYIQKDDKGLYICLVKEDIDNIADKVPVMGVDSENNTELIKDWNWLYENWDRTSDTIPSQPVKLKNSLTEGVLQGYEEAGSVKCYKVYLKGMCQLIKFDVNTLKEDTNPGTDEIKSLDFPNGYYMIIGEELYLFLLTDINSSYWNGVYKEKSNDAEVTLSNHSSLVQNSSNIELSSRVNTITNDDGGYYLYRGYRTPNLSSVSQDDLMLENIANLRKVVLSETVTVIGHLGNIANPDDGFEFPKNIEYIEPLTIIYSAGTKAYIPSNNLIEIADNAFYNPEKDSVNLTLYICEDPHEAEKEDKLKRGYISLSSKIKRVGARALKAVKPQVINLTNCNNLEYVGVEAFAVGNECKNFYFLNKILSQREDITNKNLIYLPDEAYSLRNLDTNDSGEIPSAKYEEYDSEHKTLGTNIGGYRIHTRTTGLTLNDIIS